MRGWNTGLSANDCPTAQVVLPYPAVPVLAPFRQRIRPFGKRIKFPMDRPVGKGSTCV